MKCKRVIARILVITAVPAAVMLGSAGTAAASDDRDARDYRYHACSYDDRGAYWKRYGRYWSSYDGYVRYCEDHCGKYDHRRQRDKDDHKRRYDNGDHKRGYDNGEYRRKINRDYRINGDRIRIVIGNGQVIGISR